MKYVIISFVILVMACSSYKPFVDAEKDTRDGDCKYMAGLSFSLSSK